MACGDEFYTDKGLNYCLPWNLCPECYKKNNDAVHAVSDEKLCPCGHEHKPRSDGRGLRTYCVKGSQCNSDKCKEFVSVAKEEQ